MTDTVHPNRYGTPPQPEKQLSTAEKFAHFIEDLGLPQTPTEPEQLPAPEKTPESTPQDHAQTFGDVLQAQLDQSASLSPFGYVDSQTGTFNTY